MPHVVWKFSERKSETFIPMALVRMWASNFVGKFGENLLKPLHTLYNLYRYTTRSLKMFEWSILVEYFKNYPKFSTFALYLYAMHAVICNKIFWNSQYNILHSNIFKV
jgi:hypothetical protein